MFSFLRRPVLKSISFTTSRGLVNNVRAKASDKLTRKLNEVDDVVKSTGRVPTREFLLGLKEMMQPGTEVTPTQGLIMLRCCGSLLQEETAERRNELVEQTWSALIDREVRLDISHYNALLRVYLENSKEFDPLQFLEDLEAKKIQPNRVTYQRIIHHFCNSGQMDVVAKLLLMLKEKNVPLTDTIFNSLLMGYIKADDFDGFQATLRMMSEFQLEPTDETYTIILSTAAEMSSSNPRSLNLFNDTIEELQQKNINLSDQQKLHVATHIPESSFREFDQIISTCVRNSEYNTDCYNAILELVNQEKIAHAMKLLRTMSRSNSPLFQSGYFMIRQMVKTGINPTKVVDVCDQLKKDGLTKYALSVAVEAAFDHCDLQTCRMYLSKFIEESDEKVGRPHYYWPVLTKCSSDAQVLDVVLNDMASMDKLCPARSILDTFEEYVWTKNIRDPILFLEQIKTAGWPSSLIATSLVNHHLQNHRLSAALGVLAKNTNIFVHPRFIAPNLATCFAKEGDVREFGAFIRKLRAMATDAHDEGWIGNCLLLYVSSGGHNRIPIQKVLSEMKGIKISATVLDTIKERDLLKEEEIQMFYASDAFSYTKSRNGDARDDIEALENHLVELRSRGMDTRGCQRKLLLAYCKKPAIEKGSSIWSRVEELVKDLESSHSFSFTPALNASLMDFYANHGEIEKAMDLKKKIPTEFSIDPFKILDLATALIKEGQSDEAMNLIQEQLQVERPQREEGTSTDRNVLKILNAAAEVTRDPKIVSRFLNVVLPLVNVKKATNVMLGPMIKVHLLNDNLKGALEEFAYAASTYGVTPWRGELMRKVIEMDDPVNLQLLTDITVKIYGEPVALVDVAVAFIAAGKLPQAKKVMSHPSFSLANRAIINAAERFVTKNEIELLEKFVDTVHQSPAKIDKEPIYFQLIRGYASRNDPQKALDVWTTMQEREEIPSARTLRYLGSFLKESGLEVPFDYSDNRNTISDKENDKIVKRDKKKDDLAVYNSAVQDGELDAVIQKRNKLISEGFKISVSVEGNLITRLINSDRCEEAVAILSSLIDKGVYPAPRVLRLVIGCLNKSGDVEAMESIQGRLPEQFKNQSWYTNQLAYCYLNSKQEDKFVSEVLPTLKPCPLSAVLTLLQARPEFESKIMDVAEKSLKDENNALIHNMIWSHRMISHRFDDARDLFNSIPQMKNTLLFQTLINRVRLEKDIELADALASTIEETNLMGRKLAEVHSAKIDALVELEKVEEAENHLMHVICEAKTRTSKIKIEDLKRMTLVRLRQKLIEVCNREPRFEIPQKAKVGEDESQQQDRVADTL